MIKVYSAKDPADAHLIRGMLESNGLRSVVQGEALWSARGELPLTPDTGPSVWVAAESDYETARRLIDERERGSSPTRCSNCGHDLGDLRQPQCPECGTSFTAAEPWICPDCEHEIEGQFTDCWNCAPDDASV